MHQQPSLTVWITGYAERAVDSLVTELAARCSSDDELIEAVTDRLKVARIELGVRSYEPTPWSRTMSSDAPDISLLRRGVRPGQSYTHEYTVYRVDIVSGAELIECGANGGPYVDPMFMQVQDRALVIRAADDQHRAQLFRELEDHTERANGVIEEWNSVGLAQLVRRAVARRRNEDEALAQRAQELQAAGFHRRDEGKATTTEAGAGTDSADHVAPEQSPFASAGATDGSGQTALSVLISWSHRDAGSTDSDAAARADKVLGLVNALRGFAVDADVDLFHQHEGVDWTRWGPGRMREVDFVLVVISERWRQAWDGDSSAGAGATAEADVLKSWFNRDRDDFNRRTRLVVLPGEEAAIPDGLDRLVRHHVHTFDEMGMESLLRDLTNQPQHVPAPLGARPLLPPHAAAGARRTPTTSTKESPSEYGGLEIVDQPLGLPSAIQQAVDDFVAAEQRAFERNEGHAAQLSGEQSAVVANHSSVTFTLELDSQFLLSYVVRCDYLLPGAATSYQRTVGLTFRRSDGRQLQVLDVLVDEPASLPSLQSAFVLAAERELGEAFTATGVPAEATLAVRAGSLGFCTARYDVGPGAIGAPVVWVPHQAITRTYRPDFQRLLPPSAG